jgi:outer membrane receptor protein involved in Fe transport
VTYDKDFMEALAVPRTLNAAAMLSPGVHATGPSGNLSISGAQSYENLFLVNGVVVNENIRGQAFSLFIEDAIEETTTTLSGISAEYGRFAGGVVNTVTRAGGNQLSGSYRLNLSNDAWRAATQLTTARINEISHVHEATLGGSLSRDKLWFFLAARDHRSADSHQLADGTTYTYRNKETRWESKLTFSPGLSHRIIAAYTSITTRQYNRAFNTPIDEDAIDPSRYLPQSLLSLSSTSVIDDSFFLEGQYSARDMAFVSSGGENKDDRILGTPMIVSAVGISGAPYFCGSACGNEHRDNENLLLKGSWFVATEALGTHDLIFGYDRFSDVRLSNNYQSASNYVIWVYTPANYGPTGLYYPVITGEHEEIDIWPVLFTSSGTDYTTSSIFINDTWRLDNNITLSLGARYDDNDGQDGSGATVADDSRISPRLGLTWDVAGDGKWLVHASAARYVMAISNAIASRGGAGTPSWFGYGYHGPAINSDADGNPTYEYTTHEVIAMMFSWFDDQGGLANTDLWYYSPTIRGVNTAVKDLKSPYTDELALGFTKTLGNRGLMRIDYVHRSYGSFYMTRRDLGTGTISWTGEPFPGVEISQVFDYGLTINDDEILRREYDGLHGQLQYRISDRLSFGGNWTWSHARGNFDGESRSSGPITGDTLSYPEYRREEWSYETGDLAIDQRHKLNAWLIWEIISSANHSLSLSWLESYFSGTPYGARERVAITDELLPNPGYAAPPTSVMYSFFSGDAFRSDSIHHTDIGLSYSFFRSVLGSELEIFIQPEIINLFNEQGVVRPNTTVYPSYLSFNPYQEQPVEGVHFTRDKRFGDASSESDYQAPRTFQISLGIRF